MLVYLTPFWSASSHTWNASRAVNTTRCPRRSSSRAIGMNNGTCGVLSKSIQIFTAGVGSVPRGAAEVNLTKSPVSFVVPITRCSRPVGFVPTTREGSIFFAALGMHHFCCRVAPINRVVCRRVEEQPVRELQRQQLVDRERVILVTLDMSADD